MSLVIPQGKKSKIEKKAQIIELLTDEEDLVDLVAQVKCDGKAPIYLLSDEDTSTLFVSRKPFTLAQAQKETGRLEEEEM